MKKLTMYIQIGSWMGNEKYFAIFEIFIISMLIL
jgi:hypothetical protein